MTTYKLKNTDLVYLSDEFGHSYEIKGEPVAGVTTILGLGVPPEAGLLEYFKRNTIEDQEAILTDAKERGTNVHKAIETLLLGGKVDSAEFKRPHEKKAITAFVDWYQKVKPTNCKPEMIVAYIGDEKRDGNTMRFAGTLDLIATINGKRVLVDFKTSKVHSQKNALQIEAYKQAYEQAYGEKVEDGYLLYLGTGHKGTRPKDLDGMPSNGYGWNLVKSEDTFDDFKRAYDMALWVSGGYPKPPKVEVYPTQWELAGVDKEQDADIKELMKEETK
mgnify:CR=1 FL=1